MTGASLVAACNAGDPGSIPGSEDPLGIQHHSLEATVLWCSASLIVQLWRRERLPTPGLLGFSCGSAGKESACKVGDLGSTPGLGRSSEEGKATTPVFWPGESHGLYSPWGHKESDTTERLPPLVAQTVKRLPAVRETRV